MSLSGPVNAPLPDRATETLLHVTETPATPLSVKATALVGRLVLGDGFMLSRHLGKIVLDLYPDMPLMDLAVFNASG